MTVSQICATPEQEEHSDLLVKRRFAMDASGPGTGKTLTSLLAFNKSGCKRLLVIAPPIALRMWMREIKAQTGLEPHLVKGSGKKALSGLHEHRALVVSEGLLPKDPVAQALASWVSKVGETAVIADEAHAYKSLDSKRTAALYGRRALRQDGITKNASYVWVLTGTPIRKYADDMFPHFKALRPDLLRANGVESLEAYYKQFTYRQLKAFHPRQRPTMQVVGNRNLEQLRAMMLGTGGLAVRRRLADMIKYLPPLTIQDVPVEYDNNAELKEATAQVYDYESGDGAAATVRRLLGIAKAPYCMEKSYELHKEVQQPILVLFWHKEVRQALIQKAMELGVPTTKMAVIDGSTSAAHKADYEDRFNSGDLDFLFGQIASMGVSLNLQANQFGDFAELDWTPGNIEQAYKRLFRMGQKKHVHIRLFSADHPADEAALMVFRRKQTDIERIIGEG